MDKTRHATRVQLDEIMLRPQCHEYDESICKQKEDE